MEYLNELEFIYVKNQDFNIYKKAHMIFFSYEGENIKYLLLKKDDSNEDYSLITTTILQEDNAPTFSIARVLSMNLRSLFNQTNFKKMFKKEEITKEDLLEEREYFYHELWENKIFIEWLENLTDDPIIQYDLIQGHQFYFYEIPNLENLEQLNENLKRLDLKYRLKYFNSNIFNNIKLKDENKNLTASVKIDQLNINANKDITENDNTNIDILIAEINPLVVKLFKSFDVSQYIQDTFLAIKENKLSKYFILSIKPAEGTKQDQAGFFHFPALFQGIYRKNNEIWIYLVCSIKELPLESDLKDAKAILIPGSHLSVYNDHDFLRKTEAWIKNFHQNHENVKFLGICFGMQIFVTAMGGKVEKMEHPFVRGPTKIDLKSDFWDLEFVKKSGVIKTEAFNIMQAHGDECTFIPEDLKIKNFGKSDSCFNEIMVCEDERIFLIQGHPEYHPAFNVERMVPFYLMREKKEKTLENILELKKQFLEEMNKIPTHSLEFRILCNSFLKS